MHVRSVRMIVAHGVMSMRMAMCTLDYRVMTMIVVTVVMPVSVFVLHRAMAMRMPMPFGQMEKDRNGKEGTSSQRQPAGAPFAHGPRCQRTDERTDGKDGSCPTSTDATLSKQIEAKARAIETSRPIWPSSCSGGCTCCETGFTWSPAS